MTKGFLKRCASVCLSGAMLVSAFCANGLASTVSAASTSAPSGVPESVQITNLTTDKNYTLSYSSEDFSRSQFYYEYALNGNQYSGPAYCLDASKTSTAYTQTYSYAGMASNNAYRVVKIAQDQLGWVVTEKCDDISNKNSANWENAAKYCAINIVMNYVNNGGLHADFINGTVSGNDEFIKAVQGYAKTLYSKYKSSTLKQAVANVSDVTLEVVSSTGGYFTSDGWYYLYDLKVASGSQTAGTLSYGSMVISNANHEMKAEKVYPGSSGVNEYAIYVKLTDSDPIAFTASVSVVSNASALFTYHYNSTDAFDYQDIGVLLPTSDSKTVEYTFRSTEYNPADGRITIHKYDDDGNPLEGAYFYVYNSDPQKGVIVGTNSEGVASLKDLTYGHYTITESDAPEGYIKDENTYTCTLSKNSSSASFNFFNQSESTELVVWKRDAETRGIILLSGFEYEIYKVEDDGTETLFLSPESEGYKLVYSSLSYEGVLPAGEYRVYETKAPDCYEVMDGYVSFTSDGVNPVDVDLFDSPKKSTVTIEKTAGDEEVKELNIQISATFNIYAAEDITVGNSTGIHYYKDQLIGTLTSNTESIDLLPGNYYAVETEVEDGYSFNESNTYDFTVTLGEETTVSVTNVADRGILRIQKIGDDGTELNGAVFDVYAATDIVYPSGYVLYKAGELVKSGVTTSGSGVASVILFPGVYSIKETSAPKGYVLSSTETLAEVIGVEKAGIIDTVIIENKKQYGEIDIYKTGNGPIGFTESETKYGTLTTFTFGKTSLANAVFALTANENIYNGTTLLYSKDDIVATVATDKNGYANITSLPFGSYVLKEIAAPQGYMLNTQTYYITITDKSHQAEQVISSSVSWTNTYKSVTLTIAKLFEKLDSESSIDPTATFGIYTAVPIDIDGKTVESDSLVGIVSARNGVSAETLSLPLSMYYIKELETSAGYQLDEGRYALTLTESQYVLNYTPESVVTNSLLRGNLEIVKTAEGRVDYSGFRFKISGFADNGEAFTKTLSTNPDGIALFENIPTGTYLLEEIASEESSGYTLMEPVSVTVTANETTTVEVENTLKKGSLSINKKEEGGNPEGFTFRVTSTTTAGMIIDKTVTTDSNGIATLDNLPVGTYTVTELNDNQGYVENESQTVEVKEGETAIVSFNNLYRKGNLVIKKIAEYKTDLTGFAFRVVGSTVVGASYDTIVTTNADGIVTLNDLPIGNYTIIEISNEINANYVALDPVTVSVEEGKTTTCELKNTLKRGSLLITKIAEGENAEGFSFRVTGTTVSGTSYDQTFTTDENGQIFVEDLVIGDYIVREVESDATAAYLVPPAQALSIEEDQTTSVEVVNLYKRGNLVIEKSAEGVSLEGFQFRVIGTTVSGTSYDETFTTDQDGKITITGLLIGNYTVTEVASEATNGYIIPAQQEVSVVYNETSVLNFLNIYQRGSLVIKKTSENGVLDGFQFRVIGSTVIGTTYDETFTTDSNGEIIVSDLLIGTYTVIEQFNERSAAYCLANDTTVEVVFNETTTVPVYNELLRGNLLIKKTSESGIVEGFSFRVTGTTISGNTYDKTFVTDKNGEVLIENLLIGTYTVTEQQTTATAAYEITDPVTVIVSADQTVTAEVYNKLLRGTLRIEKTVEDGNAKGFEFRVTGLTVLGTTYDQTFTTDENGEIVLLDLLIGTYTVEEQETLATTPYRIPTASTVEINANDTISVSVFNKLLRGNLAIHKTAEDDKVEGISFHITGTTMLGTTYDETFVTDEDGQIFIEDLLIGIYRIEEVQNEKTVAYVEQDAKTIGIFADDTTDVFIYNELLRGSTDLVKTDSVTGLPIEGVVFVITDVDGNEIARLVTDENGVANTGDLPYGTYYISEVLAKEGYVLENSPTEFTIQEHKQVVEFAFENTPMYSTLVINKTDENGNPMQGVEFTVYDAETNEVVAVITTDSNGVGKASLRYGSYYFDETKTPELYVPCERQYFSISENDLEITYDIINSLEIVESEPVPTTGENSKVPYAAAVAMAAAFAVTGSIVSKKRKSV